jgi:SSS family solute:Na+ symporter
MAQNSGDHFHMILKEGHKHYMALPGLAVLFGGMWIVNLNYWGCNQYITQRALGADLKTAREGLLFAAFLKLLMPVIVVLPGIAAYTLYQKGMFQQEMMMNGELNQDNAYPVLLNLLPSGLKGLSFAALTAAIVASLAGKANSISTIFTLDIYHKYMNKDADEATLVRVGRIATVVAMILAIVIAPFMGIDKKGGFQFIQEMTGLVSPGLFAAFFMGFFWKKANSLGALIAIVGGFLLALWMNYNMTSVPFIDRMGMVWLLGVGVILVTGFMNPSDKGLEIDATMFKPSTGFAIGAAIVLTVLTILYYTFW